MKTHDILAQISSLTKETIADKHQCQADAARERAEKDLAEGKSWEHGQEIKIARKHERIAASFRRMAKKDLAR